MSRHFTGRTEENEDKPVWTSCLRAKILNQDPWNTKQKCNHLKAMFGGSLVGLLVFFLTFLHNSPHKSVSSHSRGWYHFSFALESFWKQIFCRCRTEVQVLYEWFSHSVNTLMFSRISCVIIERTKSKLWVSAWSSFAGVYPVCWYIFGIHLYKVNTSDLRGFKC
jgi:hypothetical protein